VKLDGRASFQMLFDDPANWINYDPSNNGLDWGWTLPRSAPNDIVITCYALRMGVWTAAATIVHELAHLSGAPGGNSQGAELRVRACKLQSKYGPYDPTVRG
jgi:hypothetical protein